MPFLFFLLKLHLKQIPNTTLIFLINQIFWLRKTWCVICCSNWIFNEICCSNCKLTKIEKNIFRLSVNIWKIISDFQFHPLTSNESLLKKTEIMFHHQNQKSDSPSHQNNLLYYTIKMMAQMQFMYGIWVHLLMRDFQVFLKSDILKTNQRSCLKFWLLQIWTQTSCFKWIVLPLNEVIYYFKFFQTVLNI